GITGLTAGTLYYVRAYATNPVGTSYGSQVSFTSYAPGSIGTNQEICSGATPAMLTSTAAAVGMPSVTYQWQTSANNSTYNDISGATSLTYQAGELSAATYYRRNAISGSVTLSSNVITVSINAGATPPTPVTATPATILSGANSNLNGTAAGSSIKWYDAATGGTLLNTTASAANYSVSPTATKTYYAQAAPISCTDNTLELILSNLNSNYTNITSQIPSPYAFTDGVTGNYINDGGSDMYDNGNYLNTNNSSSFSYSDNTILTSTIFGTGGKYFTRKVNNLFVMAADMNNVSWFSVNGDYGSDGGGLTSSSTFSVTVGCKTFNCFLSRVYNASDPSINELFIIPANASATHTGIANTSNSTHTLNTISATTRMFYLLYAGTNGSLISDASAQNIVTAFITQTQAVINGVGGCPSAVRTPVTVTVSAIPTVTTDAVSAIAATTATGGGNVTADGGSTVSARGVCWNTAQNPTTSNFKTTNGTGTGTFTSSITGLTVGSTYYVRAYATNAMGTAYGSQVSFTPYQLGAFANINKTYGDAPFVLINPASASPGTFSYTSSNTGVATISGNTVTIIGAGTSTITATQAASGGYGSASTTCTLTVAKANQTLTLLFPTTQPLNYFTGGNTLTITGSSSSGLPVTVSINTEISTATATLTYSGTPGIYNLSDVSNAGTIVFVADQTGNTNYNLATLNQSLTVTMGNQIITFAALPVTTYGNPSFTVSATGGSSGNPVTFTSSNTSIATCTGSNGETVTIVGAGSCLITANQAGNGSWNAAPSVSQTLLVNKASPVITFNDINKVYSDLPFTVSATSSGTGAFTYTSGNNAVATLSGNTATIAGVGTSTLTASQAADANYLSASENATLTVGKANQTISISAIADILLIDFAGNPIEVTATSTSGLAVSLTLSGSSVATLNGTQLESTLSTGNVTVYVNQAGDDNYNAASQASESFAVSKADQTITFDALPVKHVGDPDFDLDASSTSSLLITYTSATPAVASVLGKLVTVHSIGSTNITASQPGNDYYNAAASVLEAQAVEGEVFFTWTGDISTAWNTAGNWSSMAVPTSNDNAIIPASPTRLAHINTAATSPAACNKLTVNPGGSLTIDAGKALTVNGVFANSGTMLIESSASGTGSLITNSSITNSGTISMQRYISKDTWHLISSPIADATANIYLSDYLQLWDETGAKWIDIISPATTLNVAEGYGLWTTQAAAYTYTYSGTPNTGNKSKTLTFTEVPFVDNDGANLLGNPYPSSIDWGGLDDTWGALYYWDGNGYASWNDGAGAGSQYVPPMQGFFIVTGSAGTFSLSNTDRVHSDASFYKSGSETKNNSIVLETTGSNYTDKLYIRFDDETNEGFDLLHDAYKFTSNMAGVSNLYSFTGDKKLSIDVRPQSEVLQLGFTNDQDGTYQIGINAIDGISEAVLEDTKTGNFSNLLSGSYSFAYSKTDDEKRFKLHFAPLGIENQESVSAKIYSYQKTVYVNLIGQGEGDILIYNIAGQLVASKLSAVGMNTISLSNTGNYIVKVICKKNTVVRKIRIQ
ncbi:MAG: T9SS type A sorting domain-containing protein, partial [Bacteroidales bacterium]